VSNRTKIRLAVSWGEATRTKLFTTKLSLRIPASVLVFSCSWQWQKRNKNKKSVSCALRLLPFCAFSVSSHERRVRQAIFLLNHARWHNLERRPRLRAIRSLRNFASLMQSTLECTRLTLTSTKGDESGCSPGCDDGAVLFFLPEFLHSFRPLIFSNMLQLSAVLWDGC